jgi:PST family polysaccharide transporter
MVAAIAVGVIWGPLGVAVGASVGQAVNWLLLTIFPMARTGVARLPLLRVSARFLIWFTPLALVGILLSTTVLASMTPWVEALILGGLSILWIAAGAVVPSIRQDYRGVYDVVRRIRR